MFASVSRRRPTGRSIGLKPDGPSMTGLDRSGWEPLVVQELVDGVYAWHTYARVYHFTDKTTRRAKWRACDPPPPWNAAAPRKRRWCWKRPRQHLLRSWIW